MNCVHCGKPTPEHHNYCGWDCVVAAAEADGGKKLTPNGLPVRCVRADGTMLECEGGDYPTYLFPVVVDCPDCENPEYATELHALIYTDGCAAVTLYECCFSMFSARDGECLGGFSSKTSRLSADAIAKITERWPSP